jgi:hypothetical protein
MKFRTYTKQGEIGRRALWKIKAGVAVIETCCVNHKGMSMVADAESSSLHMLLGTLPCPDT